MEEHDEARDDTEGALAGDRELGGSFTTSHENSDDLERAGRSNRSECPGSKLASSLVSSSDSAPWPRYNLLKSVVSCVLNWSAEQCFVSAEAIVGWILVCERLSLCVCLYVCVGAWSQCVLGRGGGKILPK